MVLPEPGFLEGLRALCDRHGVVLIFDEVMTGFRVARGGAQAVTGDYAWRRWVDLAIRCFAGDNDCGAVMWDPETSGGYDGLTATGPNLNQGAESTLALISTLQHIDATGITVTALTAG